MPFKCNPDARILGRLHAAGAGFEIASSLELHTLTGLGVRADDVIFSNPVKPWRQIREAARAGVWRFAFDSATELEKLAEHAPGAAVYVRLATGGPGSKVPSEGKFGVGGGQAISLVRHARSLGLEPYGVAYHVGSQMTDPTAWEGATRQSGAVLRELETHGIRLRMLNIGGGLPARYNDELPDLSETVPASGRPSPATCPTRSSCAPNQAVRWSPKPACWSPLSSAPPSAAADPGCIWTWARSTA